MKIKVDIILPVLHEEENIGHVLLGIKRNVKTSHRVYVVWQDHNDPTISILKQISKKMKNLVLIKSDYGVGMLNALKTGFRHAKSDIIVMMMSDMSDNPSDIDKMINLIDQGYDLVCASRYTKKGNRVGGPKIKGFLSYFACITLQLFTGIPTSDATNAFKCFRRDFIENVKIESIGGFEFPLELTVKAYFKGKKITEIPTIWRERKSGKSKFELIKWLPHYFRWYLLAVKKRYSPKPV